MSTRPRGFINYTPKRATAEVIAATQQILDDYADILPITLRQLFYILVTANRINKTEKGYKRLGETMNKARRSGLIDMDAIRDDGFRLSAPNCFDSKADLLDTFRYTAKQFRLDRQDGQERRLQIWCEAAGMIPQLERVAHPYGIAVSSSGGFDSTTAKHQVGRSLSVEGALTVLHLGDHDPSGVHMFKSLAEDVSAFAQAYGGDIQFVRLAVTPVQIDQYDLPTAPAKATDNRSFKGLTTQCEALDPRTLRQVVQDAIEARFDLDTYNEILVREQVISKEVTAWLNQSLI